MVELLSSDEHKLATEDHFGFRETPFGVAPDPRFFYGNPHYLEGLAALAYGIQAKKGFMLVTGEVGTGKTILLRKVMRQLDATTRFVFVSTSHLTSYGLVELMVQKLGLISKDKTRLEMTQELNAYLLQQISKGQLVALLIDEAQKLSDEALESLCDLSNLETDEEKLLQIVLVGQPELIAKLSKSSLRRTKQRIAIHHRICSLPLLNDVEHYIHHRLQVAGYEGPEIFTKEAVEAIWCYSAGTPRLINIICDNALGTACRAGRKRVSAYLIMKVAGNLLLERGIDVPRNRVSKNGIFRAKPSAARATIQRPEAAETKASMNEEPDESMVHFLDTEQVDLEQTPKFIDEEPAVSPQFFDHMDRAATEAIGPMAKLILGDQISALGESRDAFPQKKLGELIQRVSREIFNETMRTRFQNTMAREINAPKTV
ncbi:MAG: AAA family ATPase [Candidatus Binatia bacterium]